MPVPSKSGNIKKENCGVGIPSSTTELDSNISSFESLPPSQQFDEDNLDNDEQKNSKIEQSVLTGNGCSSSSNPSPPKTSQSDVHKILTRNSQEPTVKESSDEEFESDYNFEWTPYAELHLLNSLRGLRPIGRYRNFYLGMVHERFTEAIGEEVPIQVLKNKLDTFYNFDEAFRISGEDDDYPCSESEFSLPLDEFPEVAEMKAKLEAEKKKNADDTNQ